MWTATMMIATVLEVEKGHASEPAIIIVCSRSLVEDHITHVWRVCCASFQYRRRVRVSLSTDGSREISEPIRLAMLLACEPASDWFANARAYLELWP